MVKHNPTLNYDTTLAQWRQSIKAIKTKYVEQHGYGAATDDRWSAAIEFIQRALKLEAKLAPRDVYVPAAATR
jgi:cyclopropane fatty-acyl-phospholipid synthase-like methyltransferase